MEIIEGSIEENNYCEEQVPLASNSKNCLTQERKPTHNHW